jgi:prolyl-tRNA editing enzyme YbaK/EbsC (Cys-tRNA(Pro) deacylase)
MPAKTTQKMPRPTLGPADLRAYLQAHGIPGEVVRLPTPTPTVETAARAAGTRPEQIVKSILFLAAGQPVLVIANGTARIDHRALAARFGVSRKKVRLATPEEVWQLTGFEVGALPPFGGRASLLTLLDRQVLEQAEVYAGGGAEDTLLRLAPATILAVSAAEVADLVSQVRPGSAQEPE